MKTCPHCKEEKPLSEFHVDGTQAYCKKCVNDRSHKAYVKGRIIVKPIQEKYGVTRTDAAIIWGVKDQKTVEQFAKHIKLNEETGCIEWTGATLNGYGIYKVNTGAVQLSAVKAHRFAWAMRHGIDAMPKAHGIGNKSDTLVLNHLCHNRKCVNPDHLEVITQRENVSSAKRKPKESTDV